MFKKLRSCIKKSLETNNPIKSFQSAAKLDCVNFKFLYIKYRKMIEILGGVTTLQNFSHVRPKHCHSYTKSVGYMYM